MTVLQDSPRRVGPAEVEDGIAPPLPPAPAPRKPVTDLSWVMGGKLVLMGSNAVLMLLLAHYMNLVAYGVFVTAIGCQLLVSRALLVGVDYGIIRLRTMPELRDLHTEVTHAGLVIVGGTSLLLLAGGALGIPVLEWIRPNGWFTWAALSVVLGAIGTAMVDYGHYYRLSRLQYRTAVSLQAGTALLRLLLTGSVAMILSSPAQAVFLVYPAAALLVGLGHAGFLLRGERLRVSREMVKRVVRYSAWQGATNLAIVLSQHQGTFLLMLLGMRKPTGVYGAALTLGLGFFAIYNAYSEFLFPRMMRVKVLTDLPRFLLRSLGAAAGLCLALIPLVIGVGYFGSFFFRPEMKQAVPAFYWLAAAMLLLVLQAPLEAACHYLMRPQLQTASLLLRVVSIAILGSALVPERRSLGAAMAQFGGTAIAMVVLAVALFWSYHEALRMVEKGLPTGESPS